MSKAQLESNTYGDPDAFVSPSGRTRIAVSLDDRGKGTVFITRDGHAVQRIDLERESNVDA